MDISNLYDLFLSSEGICTDTRKLKKGDLYLALKGDNFNGNAFARQAIDAGAIAAVIDEPAHEGAQTFLVPDGLKALQQLAQFHRRQLSIPLIGLTGSNGKTTSKELLVAVLSEKYKVAYTKGNLNNHIGVPLTLLEINESHEIAVVEMGANAQKEIEFLSSLSSPDIGFITNYGLAHLEGFGGPEGVIKGKSELFENLREHNKLAWVNINDAKQLEKSEGITRRTYGDSKDADFPVFPIHDSEDRVSAEWQGLRIESQLTGAYNFSNMAIAISLGAHFGLSADEIKSGIEAYTPQNNRSQLEAGVHNRLVKDYYNANPSSMLAALENFKGLQTKGGESKWVILGDMFEMGEYEATEHQRIADLANSQGYEKVILVGKAFANTEGQALKFADTASALSWTESHLPQDKLILVKGSRGMTLEKIAEIL